MKQNQILKPLLSTTTKHIDARLRIAAILHEGEDA